MRALLSAHPVLNIALVLFFEELGVPLPLPGDVMMMLGGIEAARGTTSLATILLIEEAVTLAGATLLYLGSRRVGRPLVLRYGRYIGVTEGRLEAAEGRLRAHGRRTVIIGRLFPGARILTVITAGTIQLPPRDFLPALAVGAFLYLSMYTLLGYWVGPAAVAAFERLTIPVTAVLSLAGLIFLGVGLRAVRRSPLAQTEMGRTSAGFVLGGLISGGAGLLAANVVVGLLTALSSATGQGWDVELGGAPGAVRVLVGWPLFLGVACALGIEAWWLTRRGWRRRSTVLAVTLPPLLLSLLLLDQLRDAAGFAPDLGATILAAAGVMARWAGFAATMAWLPELASEPTRAAGGVH
ncbi:MAG: DedA family protein [Dehalococcoidia bacterium]